MPGDPHRYRQLAEQVGRGRVTCRRARRVSATGNGLDAEVRLAHLCAAIGRAADDWDAEAAKLSAHSERGFVLRTCAQQVRRLTQIWGAEDGEQQNPSL